MPFQQSLFGTAAPVFDAEFSAVKRLWLDGAAWIDHAQSWLEGSDALFRQVLRGRTWGQRTRRLWDQEVVEPRLTSSWRLENGAPLDPVLLESMRLALGKRYGVTFDSVGFNWYRDGRDSVAWHRDKIDREIAQPVVALLSLGDPRRLLVRPKGGGRSVAFALGRGDLLVTGGATQRTWEHCVPKVARAGPRISIAFRHGMLRSAYGGSRSPGGPPP